MSKFTIKSIVRIAGLVLMAFHLAGCSESDWIIPASANEPPSRLWSEDPRTRGWDRVIAEYALMGDGSVHAFIHSANGRHQFWANGVSWYENEQGQRFDSYETAPPFWVVRFGNQEERYRSGDYSTGRGRALVLAERATSQDPAPASLLDLLSEYPEIKRPEWRRLLGSCFSRGAFSRPFRIDQREEYFRSASRAAIDKNIKLVVAETFYGGNGMSGQYARLALCSVPVDPASDPKLLPLNLRRVNNEQSWDDLLKCCGPLLESHKPIGPEKRIFDAIDALVISYFDGQHWKSRAWIDVLAQIDMSGAKRLGDLTAEQRAALELMQLIKSRINVPDFPGEYDVFLSALYKTPENENRR